ncbi:unnamed protein product [Merluccius merluccius]
MSAFVLPDALRAKREVSWLDQDFPPGLPVEVNEGDLSPGDDPWDLEGRRSHAGTVLLSQLEAPPTSRHDPQQHNRKSNEKR